MYRHETGPGGKQDPGTICVAFFFSSRLPVPGRQTEDVLPTDRVTYAHSGGDSLGTEGPHCRAAQVCVPVGTTHPSGCVCAWWDWRALVSSPRSHSWLSRRSCWREGLGSAPRTGRAGTPGVGTRPKSSPGPASWRKWRDTVTSLSPCCRGPGPYSGFAIPGTHLRPVTDWPITLNFFRLLDWCYYFDLLRRSNTKT